MLQQNTDFDHFCPHLRGALLFLCRMSGTAWGCLGVGMKEMRPLRTGCEYQPAQASSNHQRLSHRVPFPPFYCRQLNMETCCPPLELRHSIELSCCRTDHFFHVLNREGKSHRALRHEVVYKPRSHR
jgi:hypothetical protein